MSIPNANPSYGRSQAPDNHNPYERAAAAWDDRIGSARVQARNWRYIAFAAMLLALISTTGAVVLGVKKQVATYVVEVDKAGMPGRITLASEVFRPTAAQAGYFVGEVVRLEAVVGPGAEDRGVEFVSAVPGDDVGLRAPGGGLGGTARSEIDHHLFGP